MKPADVNIHDPVASAEAFEKILALRPVVVASVHHTGTWFALEYLLWHSNHRRIVELQHLINRQTDLLPGDIVHFHLTGNQTVASRGQASISWDTVLRVIVECRTVIPVRDPMKSLLSRYERHPGLDHRFIVEGFIDLVNLVPKAWLPIDLHESEAARAGLLVRVQNDVGLPVEPYYIRFARDWKAYNTRGDHELKMLYDAGDLSGVRLRMPMVYDHLVSKRSVIQPFMDRMGYGPLPWYADNHTDAHGYGYRRGRR